MNPKFKRVYHYHVRKTAGTSLNAAFWSLGDLDYQTMAVRPEAVANGMKFVGADRDLITGGDYFFATSHNPAWRLEVPPETFTVTILRDPLARVVSYYGYLLWARANPGARDLEPFIDEIRAESAFIDGGPEHIKRQLSISGLRYERSAISALGPRQFLSRLTPLSRRDRRASKDPTFRNFLARIPPRHLLTQVHMFSERMDPMEAADNVLACTAVCFTENFSDDLQTVATSLELDLESKRERRLGAPPSLTDGQLDLLRERLRPEYAMIERVREGLESRS